MHALPNLLAMHHHNQLAFDHTCSTPSNALHPAFKAVHTMTDHDSCLLSCYAQSPPPLPSKEQGLPAGNVANVLLQCWVKH